MVNVKIIWAKKLFMLFSAALVGVGAAAAAAESEATADEYVVAVAKLDLRAQPSPKADVIAVLTYGERVAATGAKPAYVVEGEGWDLITDFWYEVRAGDKEGWLAGRYILRAEVFDAAEKLTTLAAGTTVADVGHDVVGIEDDLWRLVRAGDNLGWVADRYVLPGRLYETFKKADELGKAGQGKAMVAAAIDGGWKLQFDEYDRVMGKRFYDVSPDGLKVIVAGAAAAWLNTLDRTEKSPAYGRPIPDTTPMRKDLS